MNGPVFDDAGQPITILYRSKVGCPCGFRNELVVWVPALPEGVPASLCDAAVQHKLASYRCPNCGNATLYPVRSGHATPAVPRPAP